MAFQTDSYSCSWEETSFCKTLDIFETWHPSLIVVSGVISGSDDDGVDLEVIELLAGVESRTTLRIWDGTDIDCNGLHPMSASFFLNEGDSLVIMLPLLDSIENTWDVLGDYRMPQPYGTSPFLKISEGQVTGLILGNYFQGQQIRELDYNYFAKEFLGSGICDIELPNFVVTFFHDKDLDGTRDFGENFLPIGAITIPNLGQFENFKHTGLSLYVPEEPFTVTYDQTYVSNWSPSLESSFEIDMVPGFTRSVRIGLTPTAEYSKVVYNIENDRFRCGEDISFLLSVTNEGTVPTSGVVWLEIDNRLENYVFEEEPDYIDQTSGMLGWDYEDLEAYESLRIPFTVSAPLITDPEEVGEVYVFKVTETADNSRDSYCYEVELRCAFDPNDKQAFPIREDNLALIEAPLRYTIRFQNTGNDYAKNVVVTDTLDEALDLNTFKLISSSHPRQLTISSSGGYDKKFEFTNIFLPDSISDEPNSHGYITFTISAKENTPIETMIDNTASIYFDFNPAIVTNTVSSIMVDSFPTVSNGIDLEALAVEFHPNPVTDILTFNQEVKELRFYDLSGKLVKSATRVSQLMIADLDEGMYIMKLSDGRKSTTKRVAVLR